MTFRGGLGELGSAPDGFLQGQGNNTACGPNTYELVNLTWEFSPETQDALTAAAGQSGNAGLFPISISPYQSNPLGDKGLVGNNRNATLPNGRVHPNSLLNAGILQVNESTHRILTGMGAAMDNTAEAWDGFSDAVIDGDFTSLDGWKQAYKTGKGVVANAKSFTEQGNEELTRIAQPLNNTLANVATAGENQFNRLGIGNLNWNIIANINPDTWLTIRTNAEWKYGIFNERYQLLPDLAGWQSLCFVTRGDFFIRGEVAIQAKDLEASFNAYGGLELFNGFEADTGEITGYSFLDEIYARVGLETTVPFVDIVGDVDPTNYIVWGFQKGGPVFSQ